MALKDEWYSRNGETPSLQNTYFLGHEVLFAYGRPSHVETLARFAAELTPNPTLEVFGLEELEDFVASMRDTQEQTIVVHGPRTETETFLEQIHQIVFPEFHERETEIKAVVKQGHGAEFFLDKVRPQGLRIFVSFDPRFLGKGRVSDFLFQAKEDLSGGVTTPPARNGRTLPPIMFVDPVPSFNPIAPTSYEHSRIVFGGMSDVSSFAGTRIVEALSAVLGGEYPEQIGKETLESILRGSDKVEASSFLDLVNRLTYSIEKAKASNSAVDPVSLLSSSIERWQQDNLGLSPRAPSERSNLL